MMDYIIFLLLYIIFLFIVSCVFVLVNNISIRNIKYTLKKRYDRLVIINYIYKVYAKYNELEQNKELLKYEEKLLIEKYFEDINLLVREIKLEDIDSVIDNISIEKRKIKKGEYRLFNNKSHLSKEVIDLCKMKDDLVLMICCNKLNIFIAHDLIQDHNITLENIKNKIDELSKKYERKYLRAIPKSTEQTEQNKEIFNDLKKDMSTSSYAPRHSLVFA